MRRPFRILLKIGFVLAFAASAQAQGIPERVRALEATVASQAAQIASLRSSLTSLRTSFLDHQAHENPYVTSVDCAAGGSIMDILNDRRAQSAVSVLIVVTGTCVENVSILRDHVSIEGGTAGATIEGTEGTAVMVTAQDTRLDNLTIRGPQNAVRVRHGHLEGGGLRLIGGITALMGSSVRLYEPTVIEAAPEFGIDISQETLFAIANCTVSDSGFDGVRVAHSTFLATDCTIRDSGWAGLRVEEGANVRLDATTITSNEDGVAIADSSVARHVAGALSITGNRSAGIRCAAPPAVSQLVGIAASSVTGNAGGNFVSCPGY